VYLTLLAVYWLTPVSEPAPVGPLRTTVAKVRAIHKIERIFTSEHRSANTSLVLIKPMELVELEFVPEGKIDPVVAADKITAGSLPGLKENGTVAVTYQVGRPRIARMNGANRDYGWTNLATVAMPWIIGLFFMYGGSLLIAAVALLAGRILRRRRKSPQPW
jgi:hypothetical protein